MHAHQPSAQRYREVAVKTANPLQLVVMLYEGAIQALQEAQEHLKSKRIAERVRCINRATAIISELQAALNMKDGGQIAASLNGLYAYMRQRVFAANVEQKSEPLAEVIKLLDNLRSAWMELAVQSHKDDAASNVPSLSSLRAAGASIPHLNALNISG